MRIIETSDDKVYKMSELGEKVLRYGGKLMQCIEEMCGERYGERNRMGYREEPEWDDDEYYRYGKRGHYRKYM